MNKEKMNQKRRKKALRRTKIKGSRMRTHGTASAVQIEQRMVSARAHRKVAKERAKKKKEAEKKRRENISSQFGPEDLKFVQPRVSLLARVKKLFTK